MRSDQTLLYETFVDARQEAIELTDRYNNATSLDAAERDVLWEQVVRQTETARRLLVSWLATTEEDDRPASAAAAPAPELVATRG